MDRTVTCIQYGRDVYLYEDGDPRATIKEDELIDNHRLAELAVGQISNQGMRMKEMLRLSALSVMFTSGISYERLTSEEIRVEMMDSLMSVHNFLKKDEES